MKLFCVLLCCIILNACIASGSGDPDPFSLAEPASVPQLPTSPVSSVTLGTNYTGFLIGTDGLLPDGTLSQVWSYNQRLYELSATNAITPVPLLDASEEAFDLNGNIVFPGREGLIPNDLMILSEKYILIAVRKRDLDADADNDYHNLFIDLTTGTATAAPLGLNKEGNSGSLHLATLGRDFFPPDARWNDTEDLYVIDVDYETLGLMESGEFVEDENEPVDHSAGVPNLACNNPPTTDTADETDDEATDATADTTDETNDAAEDTATDTDTADTDTDTTTDTSNDSTADCPDDSADTTDNDATTDTADTEPTALSLESMGFISTRNTTADDTETDSSSSDEEVILSNGSDPVTIPDSSSADEDEEPKIPTAVYRVRLGADGTYSLDKVSAPGDRPALGQFVASRSGVLIYRNEDGGDNSYRVLLSGCEDVTGRLSTVLRLRNSTLIVADDADGNSSIFEITQRGLNKLLFSCNGNVVRESYSGYTQKVNSLAMPTNDPSIAPYEYQAPYMITPSCDSIRLFPRVIPEAEVVNPMPPIPGLASQDVRGLRKSQYFDQSLYCIGYNSALNLTLAELDTTNATAPTFTDLNFDFTEWRPDFKTLHLLDRSTLIFTGQDRFGTDFQTILLTDQGVETDVTGTLAGLEIKQHIEITPPPPPPTSTETQ